MRHSSFVEVNLDFLGENFHRIQSLAPEAEVLPMVKADAYGNGLLPVSEFLINRCQVKTLGCASLGEALSLQEKFSNLPFKIYVFSDTELANSTLRNHYLDSKILPVVHQKSDLEIFKNDPSFANIPIILKCNTGMNRLGLTLEEIDEFLPFLKRRGIKHLLTHFARSSQVLVPGDKTYKQFEEFQKIKKYLTDSGVEIQESSVSNSGAIEQGFGLGETHIRPGLMLYGPPSVTEPILWKGHQVSRFVTKILSAFHVKKGTPVGYGVNVADKDSWMAIIPLGYGDGLSTFYSGTKFTVNGVQAKIFGRINMDMAFLQFEPSAEKLIQNEDLVELWGHDNSGITDWASQNKTIPYQLMCGISSRIPRIYKVK